MNTQDKNSGIDKPHRLRHSYVQSINATPAEVFPLLCPVREWDWAPGWTTDWVITESGVAEQECLFQTPAREGETTPSIWIITRHDPQAFEVKMYKVTPDQTVGKLEISLEADGKSATHAKIAYQFTSLGPAGDKFLEGFTSAWYKEFMQIWEKAMNHYLKTGKLLEL